MFLCFNVPASHRKASGSLSLSDEEGEAAAASAGDRAEKAETTEEYWSRHGMCR